MSIAPTPTEEADHPDDEPDRQADAMKDQLRKDVASWSAARSGTSARESAELSVPVVRQPAPQPAKRVRRARAVPPEAKSDSVQKKPFSMSYDGVTQADYITYMIARGTR
jgi:hypothetical protein